MLIHTEIINDYFNSKFIIPTDAKFLDINFISENIVKFWYSFEDLSVKKRQLEFKFVLTGEEVKIDKDFKYIKTLIQKSGYVIHVYLKETII